jgi:glycine/D-amino acid oxidase-like deaminating enzyme
MLKELLGEEQIGYEAVGGCEIFTAQGEDRYRECKNALNYVNKALQPITGCETFHGADDKIKTYGLGNLSQLIYNGVEGLIDTGKMMKNLTALARASGVEILNGAKVLKVEKATEGMLVHTTVGEMHADRVCVTTNGFAATLLPRLDVTPCRAQVLMTEPIPGLKLRGAFHHNQGYDYFRHLHGRVLFGGGRHLDKGIENTDEFGTTDLIQSYLEDFLGKVILPGIKPKIEMRWSGIMGIGKAKNVIIEEVSPNLFCAVRFGGMGVALGTAAGREAASLLLG